MITCILKNTTLMTKCLIMFVVANLVTNGVFPILSLYERAQ